MKKEQNKPTTQEKKLGYKKPTWSKKDGTPMDESDPNSLWRDQEDGGFLGRPKGGQRL